MTLYENTIRRPSNLNKTDKIQEAYEKMIAEAIADKHQLKILKDTVKNPAKSMLGGPSAKEAEETLKKKFGFTDKQIKKLKEGTELEKMIAESSYTARELGLLKMSNDELINAQFRDESKSTKWLGLNDIESLTALKNFVDKRLKMIKKGMK
jgi:hypothetical protein